MRWHSFLVLEVAFLQSVGCTKSCRVGYMESAKPSTDKIDTKEKNTGELSQYAEMKYLHTSSVTAWKVWPRKQAEGRIRLKDYVVRLRTNV